MWFLHILSAGPAIVTTQHETVMVSLVFVRAVEADLLDFQGGHGSSHQWHVLNARRGFAKRPGIRFIVLLIVGHQSIASHMAKLKPSTLTE